MTKKLTALIFITALLCGCWDKTELNDRAFVNGFALDKAGDGFEAAVAVSDLTAFGGNAGEDGGESEAGNKNVRKSKGRAASEALRGTEEYSSQKLFFGQSKAVVIGEELAKDKQLFASALDALERDRELSRKNYVFISENGAAGVIEAKAEGEPSVGFFADKFYASYSQGVTFSMNLEELFISLRNCGNALAPKITEKDGKIRLAGAAVIKGMTLKGFIDGEKTRGILWQIGNVKGAKLTAQYDGAQIPFTVLSHKKKISFREGEEAPVMVIDIKAEGNLGEYVFGKAYGDDELNEIEDIFEKLIEKEVKEGFAALQNDYKTDAIDISRKLKKSDYALWLKYESAWQEAFERMETEVRVSAKIKSAGRVK